MRANPKKKIDWNEIINYKQILCDLYTKDKLSLNKIAMKFNTSAENVKRELLSLGIEIRTRQESLELSNKNVRD